jgi:hypothetical protein
VSPLKSALAGWPAATLAATKAAEMTSGCTELTLTGLHGQRMIYGRRRWNRRLLEAASSSTRGGGWAPSGPASSWECRAAQNHQARREAAQEPSWGAAEGGTLTTPTGPPTPWCAEERCAALSSDTR